MSWIWNRVGGMDGWGTNLRGEAELAREMTYGVATPVIVGDDEECSKCGIYFATPTHALDFASALFHRHCFVCAVCCTKLGTRFRIARERASSRIHAAPPPTSPTSATSLEKEEEEEEEEGGGRGRGRGGGGNGSMRVCISCYAAGNHLRLAPPEGEGTRGNAQVRSSLYRQAQAREKLAARMALRAAKRKQGRDADARARKRVYAKAAEDRALRDGSMLKTIRARERERRKGVGLDGGGRREGRDEGRGEGRGKGRGKGRGRGRGRRKGGLVELLAPQIEEVAREEEEKRSGGRGGGGGGSGDGDGRDGDGRDGDGSGRVGFDDDATARAVEEAMAGLEEVEAGMQKARRATRKEVQGKQGKASVAAARQLRHVRSSRQLGK